MNVIVVDSSRQVLLMRGGGSSLIRNKTTAEGTDEPGRQLYFHGSAMDDGKQTMMQIIILLHR